MEDDALKLRSTSFQQRLNKTIDLYNSENYQGAIELGTMLLQSAPDNITLLRLLSNAYVFLDKFDEAIKLSKRAVTLKPDSESVSRSLTFALCNARQHVEEHAEIRRYLKLGFSQYYKDYLVGMVEAYKMAPGREEIVIDEILAELREYGESEDFDLLIEWAIKASIPNKNSNKHSLGSE